MGGVDLQRDLNAGNGNQHTLYVRSHLVVVSRAAGIEPPVDAVWPYLGDEAGLREQAEFARLLGFSGKSAIHRVSCRSCTRCSHPPGGSWPGRGRSSTPSTPPAARRCGCRR
jgi:hypothetical protein